MRHLIKSIPVLGPILRRLYWTTVKHKPIVPQSFSDSSTYWEERYAIGGNSGRGSYSFLAEFKAEVINAFVQEKGIQSVVEFGCGDGNQLTLAKYPRYLGLDVSPTAVAKCRRLFRKDRSKTFALMADYVGERAELAMSLDVVFHLVEDEVFTSYMRTLFDAAERYVIVYSSNTDENIPGGSPHCRNREFTGWVKANEPGWRLASHIPNRYPYRGDDRTGSPSDFFIFERKA
jgi:SAM-dependent methyltransferase